nr:hypothetical protein [uncultured Flavobacterium sp.]
MELFVLQFLLVFLGLGFVFFNIIEPIYVFFYNKPLVMHWHLFPSRISEGQRNILSQNFPFYNRLSSSKKRYFEHRINKFRTKYQFIGHEIAITDEIIILISGTYVMLTFLMMYCLSDLCQKNNFSKSTLIQLIIYNQIRYISKNLR